MKLIDWLNRLLSSIFRYSSRDRVFHAVGGGRSMAYRAATIANYFLKKAWDDNKNMDHLKIQKLVYISHGWMLGLSGNPLVSDKIEAWDYGPVLPSLYREFKTFGGGPISKLADAKDESVDEETCIFLDVIWDIYGESSGLQLSSLTHEKDTPWYTTRKHHPNTNKAIITDDVIKNHYTEKAREMAPDEPSI